MRDTPIHDRDGCRRHGAKHGEPDRQPDLFGNTIRSVTRGRLLFGARRRYWHIDSLHDLPRTRRGQAPTTHCSHEPGRGRLLPDFIALRGLKSKPKGDHALQPRPRSRRPQVVATPPRHVLLPRRPSSPSAPPTTSGTHSIPTAAPGAPRPIRDAPIAPGTAAPTARVTNTSR